MSNTYEQDFHAWTVEQSGLLRAGRLSEADLHNIAEELESMGRSGRRELRSRFAVLLLHLLKWQHLPNLRGNALLQVDRETGLPTETFPPQCPYEEAQVFDPSFLPGGA